MAAVSPAILHCEVVLRLEAKHQCWQSRKESQSPMNTAFRSWAVYFQGGERKKPLSRSNDLSIVICKQILLLILNIASAPFLKKVVSLEPMRCFTCWPCKFIINYSTRLTGSPSPFFLFLCFSCNSIFWSLVHLFYFQQLWGIIKIHPF